LLAILSLMDEAVKAIDLAYHRSGWREWRQRLRAPMDLDGVQSEGLFTSSRSFFETRPLAVSAPFVALEIMQKTANLDLADGLKIEAEAFSELLRSEVAANLMRTFLAVRRSERSGHE
jgi:hypothetical protein